LTPGVVRGQLRFRQLAVSFASNCGTTLDNVAYCWGWNQYGQLGDGSTTDRLVPTRVAGELQFSSVAPGGSTSCGLSISGAAYCWGDNRFGQVGDGSTTDRLRPSPVSGGLVFKGVSPSVSSFQVCGVSTASLGYCWGLNLYGELGDGSTTDSSVPVAVREPD